MSLHPISNSARDNLWQIAHNKKIRRFTGYPFVIWVSFTLRLGLHHITLLDYDESLLYSLARSSRPEVVVETGTNLGVSTFFLLKAFHENGKGQLFSIDLPRAQYLLGQMAHEDYLPPGLSPGCVVPPSLRSRWSLTLGNAKTELPKLLSSLDGVDMFLHDSEHTYDHMMFEFKNVWQKLRKGGLLVSDDVYCNSSFQDFCEEVDREPDYSRPRNGVRKYGWITR